MEQQEDIVPLEQRTVELECGHGNERLPALDPRRIQEKNFLRYVAPPLSLAENFTGGTVQDWLEGTSYIIQDVEWLLGLPFDLFWCQVIFDSSLQTLIDSFLLNCPRLYDTDTIDNACHERQQHVHKLMFLVIIRLTKNRSKQNYISDNVFGDILYENFIFDIPKLMDFISIYSGLNEAIHALCAKAVSSVFMFQPKYFGDLKEAIYTIYKVLGGFQLQLGIENDDPVDNGDDVIEPVRLHSKQNRKQPTQHELNDTLLYLVDFSGSILCLLHVFPDASGVFLQENLLQRIGKIVDVLLVLVQKNLASDPQVKKRIHTVETCCAQICHCLLQDLRSSASHEECGGEFYFEVLATLLTYARLTYLYDKRYNIRDELHSDQSALHLDDAQVAYFESQLDATIGPPRKEIKEPVKRPAEIVVGSGAGVHAEETCDSADSESAVIVAVVQELFPDKSRTFIDGCISYFGADHEAIVSAIVEGRVPDWIGQERQPERPSPTAMATVKATRQPEIERFNPEHGHLIRKNRDVKQEEWNALLNDRSRFEIDKTLALCDMYEDEYDDTYDLQNIGVLDADSADELNDLNRGRRRKFVIPQVLRKSIKAESESSSTGDDSESENGEEVSETRDEHRHVKPDIRLKGRRPPVDQKSKRGDSARDETKDQGKFKGKPRRRRMGNDNTESSQQPVNETVEKRDHPEQKRGSHPQGNSQQAKGSNIKYKKHNRRAMADKKRSKGMGPLG